MSEEKYDLARKNKSQILELVEKTNTQIQQLNKKNITLESKWEDSRNLETFRMELRSVSMRKKELKAANKKLLDQLAVMQERRKVSSYIDSPDKMHMNIVKEQLETDYQMTEARLHELENGSTVLKEEMEKMEKRYVRHWQAREEEI